MPRKPTGNIGPNQITFALGDGAVHKWTKIKFSERKEEIEAFIVELFLSTFKRHGGIIFDHSKNEDSNFDYTLDLPGGRVCLDFT
jgi:hypothetical protein